MQFNTKYTLTAIMVIILIGVSSFYLGKQSNTTPETKEEVASSTSTDTGTPTKGLSTTSPQKPAVTSTSPTTGTAPKPVTTTGGSKAGFYSYTNADHNFTIQYPPYVQSRNIFSTFHEIGNNWRLYASPANQGKPIASFSIFSIDQGSYSDGKQKYPLYFTAEVRIGVSPNVKECYTPDAGYTDQKITTVTINGTTFKRFSTSEGGMMKYTQAESYRTIRNNMCYALEQIKSGSSYRDEKMAPGIADSALNNYYATGDTIIKTFKFTK